MLKTAKYLAFTAVLGFAACSDIPDSICDSVSGPSIEAEFCNKGFDLIPFKMKSRAQDGQETDTSAIIAKSKDQFPSRNYVRAMLEDFKGNKGVYRDIERESMAEELIEGFWADISKNMGKGSTTKEKEYITPEPDSLNGKVTKFLCCDLRGKSVGECIEDCFDRNSNQTLSEFIGSDDGKYYGDCDDFSMAMQTAYELSLEIAEKRAKDDNFWGTLADGLHNRPMYIANLKDLKSNNGHSMNIWFKKNDSSINLIEPQNYLEDSNLSIEESGIFIDQWNTIFKVLGICNSAGCYVISKQ
ncbi:MAG: hypothetical protein ABIB71_01035 [Candidatus Woesearchaeota archaeon]